MLETYLRARRILALAGLCVVLASGIIVASFCRHVYVPCRGTIEKVPLSQLRPLHERVDHQVTSGVLLAFDRGPSSSNEPAASSTFRNVRVRLDTECPCKGELVWGHENDGLWHGGPAALAVYQNRETGLYVVRPPSGPDVLAFRRTETAGHVFSAARLPSANNVSVLVMLGAIGALFTAGALLARARSYTSTMSTWRAARRRPDGMLEDETGVALGRLGRDHLRVTDVLVNPSKIDGRSAYREFPILDRRDVAPGTHAEWTTGTFRRFRDARTLALLSVITTVVAVAAQIVAAYG